MIGRALLVGVADYQFVSDLPSAVGHDVADVAALLRDPNIVGLPPENMTVLLDRDATACAIRSAFAEIAATTNPDAVFLFYFSGHGERACTNGREQSWLLPHDADLGDLTATAVSSQEVMKFLDEIAADRQVLLIDACHAGGIGATKRADVSRPNGFGKSGVDALSKGAGRVLLTSSRANEVSRILVGERNSVFTSVLLDAFRGETIDRGDGVIGVLDVFHYVSAEVPKRCDQHPIFHAGDLDSNFAVARRRPLTAQKGLDINQLVALFARLYPGGPMQDEVWSRAGGDLSRLVLSGTGTAQWHSALTKVRRGGGGLRLEKLIETVAEDYPGQDAIAALRVIKV